MALFYGASRWLGRWFLCDKNKNLLLTKSGLSCY